MADRYEDRYRDRPYRSEGPRRSYADREREDRGLMERAGDEVRSWFGDDDAERRRRMDEREQARERDRDRTYERDYDRPGYRRDETWSDRSRYAERGRGGERWDEPGRGSEDADRDFARAGRRAYGSGYESRYTPPYAASFAGAYRTTGEQYTDEPRTDYSGRGPKGYQRPDARITEDVCDRLADAPDVDASEIEVRVENGEVTLSGSVPDRQVKHRAENLVERVSGVRDVHNHLRIRRE